MLKKYYHVRSSIRYNNRWIEQRDVIFNDFQKCIAYICSVKKVYSDGLQDFIININAIIKEND